MPFRVGLVGLHRATGFAHSFRLLPEVELAAACDINPGTLAAASDELGIERRFTSFDEFIDSGLDAVVVSTPMPFHAPQAAAALRRGIHVLSEVPAIVDLTQAWELVEAARSSTAIYMMAENYCYIKSVGVVREMARQGLFGTPYYGEGEYLHELKGLNEITPWRRVWQTGINGMTYGTHSLGPLLWWFGERVVSVSGFGSGHHYRDPQGAEYEQEDTCMMVCKTERGGLLRVRVDMLSNRPHLMTYYSLQGTKGCYEAARGCGDVDKIWLVDHSDDSNKWRPLSELAGDFTPANWRKWEEQARKAGHGGGDLLQVLDFTAAAREGAQLEIDLYAALDFSLPGLVSQESILREGAPLPVPDFREINRFPEDLPAALKGSSIMVRATSDGQPAWLR